MGLAGGAAVAGFDQLARQWIVQADAAATIGDGVQEVPQLDGTLLLDLASRQADSTDEGNLVSKLPVAVLRPGSERDVQRMIGFCREHDIKVSARGQHHTMFGQGLVQAGLIIEMSALRTIHSITPNGADVDAGVLWKDLLQAALKQGLRPKGLTGYTALSVGGVLSVGGCPLGNSSGALVDHVQALHVVTGRGDLVLCSETQQPEVFEVALAGLGQCGIITRATIDLVQAQQMARTYQLPYFDTATFFKDFRILLNRGEINEVYNVAPGPGSGAPPYIINATIFFDPPNNPDDAFLLRGLSLPPAAAQKQDRPYVDYATSVDGIIDFFRARFQWDSLQKPWFDVWLPDSTVEQFVGEVVPTLTPIDVGPFGFLIILVQRRSKLRRPFLRVPANDGKEWVWLFDIGCASPTPGPDPAYVSQMLARNRRLFERARALGGTRYPIGALDFSHMDWIVQYGEEWPEFVRRKNALDPDGILTPGPGIFTDPTA